MQSQSIEGVGNIREGEYDRISVSGVGTCKGDITVRELIISGVFKETGRVKAEKIRCEGVGEFSSNVRVNNLYVNGTIKLNGEAKLEAEEIKCGGCISVRGEVSADNIEIDGYIKAREIYGEDIVINSKDGKYGKSGFLKGIGDFFGGLNYIRNGSSECDIIEATNITLHNVTAKQVNGENITIGENCVIDRVDCSGKLKIHSSAIVKEISGATQKVTE